MAGRIHQQGARPRIPTTEGLGCPRAPSGREALTAPAGAPRISQRFSGAPVGALPGSCRVWSRGVAARASGPLPLTRDAECGGALHFEGGSPIRQERGREWHRCGRRGVGVDLVTFLRARLDEDDDRARLVQREREGRAWPDPEPWRLSWQDEYDLLCIDPSRALAEVDAKRRILQEHRDDDYGDCLGCGMSAMEEMRNGIDDCPTLLALALPYAGHPDYRDEWKP